MTAAMSTSAMRFSAKAGKTWRRHRVWSSRALRLRRLPSQVFMSCSHKGSAAGSSMPALPAAIRASTASSICLACALVGCFDGTHFHVPSRVLNLRYQFGRDRLPRLMTLPMSRRVAGRDPRCNVVQIWCKRGTRGAHIHDLTISTCEKSPQTR